MAWGNLAPCSIDDLAGIVRTRLKRMQYRRDLLDGFIAPPGHRTAMTARRNRKSQ